MYDNLLVIVIYCATISIVLSALACRPLSTFTLFYFNGASKANLLNI